MVASSSGSGRGCGAQRSELLDRCSNGTRHCQLVTTGGITVSTCIIPYGQQVKGFLSSSSDTSRLLFFSNRFKGEKIIRKRVSRKSSIVDDRVTVIIPNFPDSISEKSFVAMHISKTVCNTY